MLCGQSGEMGVFTGLEKPKDGNVTGSDAISCLLCGISHGKFQLRLVPWFSTVDLS